MPEGILWAINICLTVLALAAVLFALLGRRKGQAWREPSKRLRIILVCALLLLGTALRYAGFDQTPAGFNQDEASAAYDAWALNEYGIDRNGDHNPVYAVAWGSGQNTLYSSLYRLVLPILGNSVRSFRLISLWLGILSLWLFYLTLRRAAGTFTALAGMFLLCVSPWHIMLCRWGLESNILPAFMLMGAYFALRMEEQPWCFLPCMCAFGLSLYAYATAYVVVPFLVLYALWRYLRSRGKPGQSSLRFWGFLAAGLCVLSLLALPLMFSVVINRFDLPAIDWGFLSIPRMTESRYESTMNLRIPQNLAQFAGSILLAQNDGLIWNASPLFGCLYFMSLPFCAAGIIAALKRRRTGDRLVLVWFGACVLLAMFTSVNINRVNAVFLPLLYFTALGFVFCAERFRPVLPAGAAAYLLLAGLFMHTYFTSVHARLEVQFAQGFGDAIRYVHDLGGAETVYVTSVPNAPYISVLFFTETPPEEFLDTVRWINPEGAFRAPSSFGRYRFGLPAKAGEDVYIAHGSELGRFSEEHYEILRFGHYAAVLPRQ